MKSVEFASVEEEEGETTQSPKSLEMLLLEKNKTLQSENTQLKVASADIKGRTALSLQPTSCCLASWGLTHLLPKHATAAICVSVDEGGMKRVMAWNWIDLHVKGNPVAACLLFSIEVIPCAPWPVGSGFVLLLSLYFLLAYCQSVIIYDDHSFSICVIVLVIFRLSDGRW